MHDPAQHSTSTLELVVNEQQLQNMSQIDLSSSGDHQRHLSPTGQEQQGLGFQVFKRWPTRFRESFNAKIDEAKANSETKTEFVFEILQSFSSVIVWFLCFICTTTLPIFLLFIGLINLDNCQARPSLPYLIFSTGFFMTASNLFNVAYSLDFPILTNHQILSSDVKNTIASIINIMFNCLVAFLYIVSAYLVYTVDTPKIPPQAQSEIVGGGGNDVPVTTDSDGQPTLNCSSLLYYFSFWFISLTLGLFAILAFMAAIFFAYNQYRLAIIRGSTPRSHTQTSSTNNVTINTDPFATNRL